MAPCLTTELYLDEFLLIDDNKVYKFSILITN